MDESGKKFLRSLSWVTDVLKRYFEGKLTRQEEEIVEEHLKSIDLQSGHIEDKLTDEQLNESDKRIKRQVFFRLDLIDPEKDSEKPASVFPAKQIKKRSVPVFFRKYAAAAAVFALVIGISCFMLYRHSLFTENHLVSLFDKTVVLQTGESEIKEITLPDGTELLVNGGSRIEYIRNRFNKEKREIWLEGETYFDVAKNPEKPFIIHSGNLQTVVRGTSFNVKAYQEIGEISVSVRSGIVEVGAENNVLDVLTANKQLIYDGKTKGYIVNESNWEEAVAWRDRRLILKKANIAELKLRMKQLYAVDIAVDGSFLDDERFGLSFQKGSDLTDVMEVIGQLYDVKYKEAGPGKIIIYQ